MEAKQEVDVQSNASEEKDKKDSVYIGVSHLKKVVVTSKKDKKEIVTTAEEVKVDSNSEKTEMSRDDLIKIFKHRRSLNKNSRSGGTIKLIKCEQFDTYRFYVLFKGNKTEKIRYKEVTVKLPLEDTQEYNDITGGFFDRIVLSSDKFDKQFYLDCDGYFNKRFWQVNLIKDMQNGVSLRDSLSEIDTRLKDFE